MASHFLPLILNCCELVFINHYITIYDTLATLRRCKILQDVPDGPLLTFVLTFFIVLQWM